MWEPDWGLAKLRAFARDFCLFFLGGLLVSEMKKSLFLLEVS